jgi:plasmid replication initiation protein
MKIKDDATKIKETRSYQVVKANELIQKSRFTLKVQEQKIILFLISKIKPEDMELKEHIFKIQDFCTVCGLDAYSGANYTNIKQTLKHLRDKSIWITLADGYEITLSWFDYIKIKKDSGTIIIKISDSMKPYLIQLKNQYTQYELLYILAMKSQYSLRLYEILKSYENFHKHTFEIDELKKRLSAEHYNLFADFQRNVLDIALREINDFSDINVEYKIIKESRRFAKIEFFIEIEKDITERVKTWTRIEEVLYHD